MTFSTSKDSMSNLVTIPTSRVREILAVNRNGGKVDSILGEDFEPQVEEPTYRTEEDSITRFDKAKKRKKKNRNRHNSDESKGGENKPSENKVSENRPTEHKPHENKGEHNGDHKGGHRHHHKLHHHHNKPKQQ